MQRFLAEHRHRLFPDEMFEDLFPSRRGRPSVPADVIATVMVLQALEGRSDREAIEALRTDLRWKVAAGLALDDEGFHPTVLTLWRNKLRVSDAPERIFDAVRAVVAETGVLRGKTRRALDSTLLDDAVATQDTVTQLVSMIRRVRKAIPAATAVEVAAHDYGSAGKPACAWDDPDARDELITGLAIDALGILDALEEVGLDEDQQQPVALLALVAGQDVEPDPQRGEGNWRIARGVASERVISTVDPESRHMHKSRSSYRDGYKAHVVVEPDTGIITGCDLTPANIGDGPVGARLLEHEAPGFDVLADSAYGSGPVRTSLADRGHTVIIKPWPLGRNPKLGDDQFRRDDFAINYTARHRHVAGRPDRHYHARRQRRLRTAMRRLPVPASLHQRQGRQDPQSRRPRPVARTGTDRLGSRHPPRRLPPAPPDGRAHHRLARRQRLPTRPLPRRRTQPHRPQPASRRPQPATPHQPRAS